MKLISLTLSKAEDIKLLSEAVNSEFGAEALLGKSTVNRAVVAWILMDADNNLLGVCGLYKQRGGFLDLFISLDNSVRGKSYGKKMLKVVMEYASGKGKTFFIQTYSEVQYSSAIGLYHKEGFSSIAEFRGKLLFALRTGSSVEKYRRLLVFYCVNLLKYILFKKEIGY